MSKLTEKLALEALNLVVIRIHAETCKECRDKLHSVMMHAWEEAKRDAKKI